MHAKKKYYIPQYKALQIKHVKHIIYNDLPHSIFMYVF